MPHAVQAPTLGLGGMGHMGGAMGTVGAFDLGAPGLMTLGGGGAPAMLGGGGGGLVAAGYGGGDLLAAGGALLKLAETPPPGCDPDAMKLFVGNIPKTCTEEQLLPLFQSVGKVGGVSCRPYHCIATLWRCIAQGYGSAAAVLRRQS